MIKDIVQLYASQMRYILIKTLIAPRQAVHEGQDSETAPEATGHPRTENAVVSGFFLGRIVTEVSNCVNDVSGLSLRGGAFMILVEMMQQIRWKFVETICENWGEGKSAVILIVINYI